MANLRAADAMGESVAMLIIPHPWQKIPGDSGNLPSTCRPGMLAGIGDA